VLLNFLAKVCKTNAQPLAGQISEPQVEAVQAKNFSTQKQQLHLHHISQNR